MEFAQFIENVEINASRTQKLLSTFGKSFRKVVNLFAKQTPINPKTKASPGRKSEKNHGYRRLSSDYNLDKGRLQQNDDLARMKSPPLHVIKKLSNVSM